MNFKIWKLCVRQYDNMNMKSARAYVLQILIHWMDQHIFVVLLLLIKIESVLMKNRKLNVPTMCRSTFTTDHFKQNRHVFNRRRKQPTINCIIDFVCATPLKFKLKILKGIWHYSLYTLANCEHNINWILILFTTHKYHFGFILLVSFFFFFWGKCVF